MYLLRNLQIQLPVLSAQPDLGSGSLFADVRYDETRLYPSAANVVRRLINILFDLSYQRTLDDHRDAGHLPVY
jgi:hypothetical protein